MHHNNMKLTPTQIKAIAEEVEMQVRAIRDQVKEQMDSKLRTSSAIKLLVKQQAKIEKEYKCMLQMAKKIAADYDKENERMVCRVSARFDGDGTPKLEAWMTFKDVAYGVADKVKHQLTLQSIDNADVDVASIIDKMVHQHCYSK